MFPSPCRVYVSFPNGMIVRSLPRPLVSVPLRGLCFFSKIKSFDKFTKECFRPLAGFMFLFQMTWRCMLLKLECFRPLAGFMFLFDLTKKILTKRIEKVSVPLRGLCFFSSCHCNSSLRMYRNVSVPLRGLCFFSTRG